MATLVFGMNVSLDGYVDHDRFAPAPGLATLRASAQEVPMPRNPLILAALLPLIFPGLPARAESPESPAAESGMRMQAMIRAPLPLAAVVDPDLIVTPLLAFDAEGGRLGQGGGYYDRTFAARPDVARVGFAYAGQVVDRLDLDPHDIRLHGVLAETGYTAFE